MLSPLRLMLLSSVILWIGTVLIFSQLRWFQRVSLAQRLRQFSGIETSTTSHSFTTLGQAFTPLITSMAEQIGRLFGLREELAIRLQRANIETDVTSFRIKQFGWSAGSIAISLLICIALKLPTPLALFITCAAPILGFLVLEQQVINAAKARQHRIFTELPVLSEQLAMLLSAGFSLGAALNRIADRSRGATGEDLRNVCDRIRHGLTTNQALLEWAEVVDIAELHRLVAVLSFSSDTTDLGRLISDEAKSIRLEAQRRLAETIDKRAQQVWIPVTVATLVPGVIFLVIPFIQALSLFSS